MPQNTTAWEEMRSVLPCHPGTSIALNTAHALPSGDGNTPQADRPTNDPRPVFRQTRHATHSPHRPSHEMTLPPMEKCTIGVVEVT
jgi:hypothetical protein